MDIMKLDPELVSPLAQDVTRAIAESRAGSIAAPYALPAGARPPAPR
jgi:hypothetical protein